MGETAWAQMIALIAGVLVSLGALIVSMRANGRADKGHTLAKEANDSSIEANRIAEDALHVAAEANRIAEEIAQENAERLTENARPLLTCTYDRNAREIVLENRSSDAAHQVKIEVHGPRRSHLYSVEGTVSKGRPVRVPLKAIFDLWVTEGAPLPLGTREYEYQITLHFKTEKGNVRSEDVAPIIYQSPSGYPG